MQNVAEKHSFQELVAHGWLFSYWVKYFYSMIMVRGGRVNLFCYVSRRPYLPKHFDKNAMTCHFQWRGLFLQDYSNWPGVNKEEAKMLFAKDERRDCISGRENWTLW